MGRFFLWRPLVALIPPTILYTVWVMRNRVNRATPVDTLIGSSGESGSVLVDEDSTRRFETFQSIGTKFIREVRKKLKDLVDVDETDEKLDGVKEKVKTLEELILKKVDFSEDHLNAFLGVWRETQKLGVKFSKELRSMQKELKELQTEVSFLHRNVANLSAELQEVRKAGKAEVQEVGKAGKAEAEENRNTIAALKATVDQLVSENRDRKAKQVTLDERLLYGEWVARLYEIATEKLRVEKICEDWKDLVKKLKEENDDKTLANPWRGPVHEKLNEEVLKPMKIGTEVWDECVSFKRDRNDDTHITEIQYGKGPALKFSLKKHFQALKDSTIKEKQKGALMELLLGLNRHFFPGSRDLSFD